MKLISRQWMQTVFEDNGQKKQVRTPILYYFINKSRIAFFLDFDEGEYSPVQWKKEHLLYIETTKEL